MTYKAKLAAEIKTGLRHFAGGTEHWYRHALMPNVVYTEGVQYLAEKAGAYWLLDKIATLQLEPKIKAEPFQVWSLKLHYHSAVLTCTDGGKSENNGDAVMLHREEIAWTDFPLDDIELWVEDDGERKTILLPSEH